MKKLLIFTWDESVSILSSLYIVPVKFIRTLERWALWYTHDDFSFDV